jgi:trehalose 6-phosphate phosphatase
MNIGKAVSRTNGFARPALGRQGHAALAAVVARSPLLAFDFDGTLAPIVARPRDARVPLALARRLARLSRRWPVAVVSGRAVEDLVGRLGFEPGFVVGNHGLQDPADANCAAWAETLEPARRALRGRADALRAVGVQVEDKRLSIALHYRLAADRSRAVAAIDDALPTNDDTLVVTRGKCVLNLTPAGAPDKGDAVATLVRRTGAGAALFVGDDVNDESVFAKAPQDWMTVRIGRVAGERSTARFYLDVPAQLTELLQSMLDMGEPN